MKNLKKERRRRIIKNLLENKCLKLNKILLLMEARILGQRRMPASN
jgi:hypothetical protein